MSLERNERVKVITIPEEGIRSALNYMASIMYEPLFVLLRLLKVKIYWRRYVSKLSKIIATSITYLLLLYTIAHSSDELVDCHFCINTDRSASFSSKLAIVVRFTNAPKSSSGKLKYVTFVSILFNMSTS